MGAERLSLAEVAPTAQQAVLGMESYVRSSGLEPDLVELVKIRASQINGCAFCLDMHHRDARKRGESQQRLDVISAWREVPTWFTARERAALAFTEAVTRISDAGVPEDVWQAAASEFTETDLASLLMAAATINVWNRLAISTHEQPPNSPSEGSRP